MKRKVLEEEEDEDVMNVKKKHKPTILPSGFLIIFCINYFYACKVVQSNWLVDQ